MLHLSSLPSATFSFFLISSVRGYRYSTSLPSLCLPFALCTQTHMMDRTHWCAPGSCCMHLPAPFTSSKPGAFPTTLLLLGGHCNTDAVIECQYHCKRERCKEPTLRPEATSPYYLITKPRQCLHPRSLAHSIQGDSFLHNRFLCWLSERALGCCHAWMAQRLVSSSRCDRRHRDLATALPG